MEENIKKLKQEHPGAEIWVCTDPLDCFSHGEAYAAQFFPKGTGGYISATYRVYSGDTYRGFELSVFNNFFKPYIGRTE